MDIKFLIKKIGITTVEEAENIILEYFPPKLILPKTTFLLEELLGEI